MTAKRSGSYAPCSSNAGGFVVHPGPILLGVLVFLGCGTSTPGRQPEKQSGDFRQRDVTVEQETPTIAVGQDASAGPQSANAAKPEWNGWRLSASKLDVAVSAPRPWCGPRGNVQIDFRNDSPNVQALATLREPDEIPKWKDVISISYSPGCLGDSSMSFVVGHRRPSCKPPAPEDDAFAFTGVEIVPGEVRSWRAETKSLRGSKRCKTKDAVASITVTWTQCNDQADSPSVTFEHTEKLRVARVSPKGCLSWERIPSDEAPTQ